MSSRAPRGRLAFVTLVALCLTLNAGCKKPPAACGGPSTDCASGAGSSPIQTARPSAPANETPASAPSSVGDEGKTTAGESMKLLDEGRPPRRKLRYEWRVEQSEQLSMDLRTTVSTENGNPARPEVPLPSVHIQIAVDPKSVTPERDLRYAWRVTSAKVDAAEETPIQVADGIRAEVAEISRLSGSALVTNRGLAKEVTIDSRKLTKGGGTGMAEQVRQTLRDVAAPLPEEAVGLGARWRKLSQLDATDALVTQAETFRLVELYGDRGSLDDALAQTAPPQVLPAPGAVQSARTRMDSMLASGQAQLRFELSRLVPQTSFDGTTQMVLSEEAMGDAAHLKTVMHVSWAIVGSRR